MAFGSNDPVHLSTVSPPPHVSVPPSLTPAACRAIEQVDDGGHDWNDDVRVAAASGAHIRLGVRRRDEHERRVGEAQARRVRRLSALYGVHRASLPRLLSRVCIALRSFRVL